jgi:hypothetical protein
VCTPPANAAPVCSAGKCNFQCQSPFIRCGSTCVDPRTDPTNCGGCGHGCPTAANSVATCSDSQCGLSCAAGFSLCAGKCCNGLCALGLCL